MQTPTTMPVPYVPLAEDVERSTIRKLDRRFLLLCTGVAFLSYVDRSNIGYAANSLCQDLNMKHEDYGDGVSLFYVGYLLSQIAGNVMLKRFGAPAWISFIVFAWGFVTAALGFIQNTTQFYVLRFVLGIAEGGAFPALWYIIPVFYPPDHVTNSYSVIFAAISFSMPFSSPFSAGLLSLSPFVNIKGWRLLFVAGGIVPMMYALVTYLFLPVSPESAQFLETEEKEWIALQQGNRQNECDISFWDEMRSVLSNGMWRLCSACCFITFGIDSVLIFWTTLIIQEMLYGKKDTDSETCGSEHSSAALAILLAAIPFLITGILCLLIRRFVVRNRTRAAAVIFIAGGLLTITWIGTQHAFFVLRFLMLIGAITSTYVGYSYVTALAMTSCEASIQSVAASVYNAIGTVGAILFPMVFGKLMDVLGSGIAISALGGTFFFAALLIIGVKDPLLKEDTNKPNEDSSCLQAPSSSA